MRHNPHVPQSRRGDEDDELGVWPACPSLDLDYELNSIFVGRVNYCQRLAARVGRLRGLGFGWRSITLACLGPIFDPDRLSRNANKDLVMWVFDRLDELRNKLVEQEGLNVKFQPHGAESNQLGGAALGQSTILSRGEVLSHACTCSSSTLYAHCKLKR